VTFAVDPSVRYLASPFPVDLIWRANRDADGARVDLGAGTALLEIRRDGDDAVFRRLPLGDWTLRAALQKGRTLDDAGGAALAADPSLDLAAALAALFSEGILTGFTLSPITEETDSC
jgi:hypothetical protein